MNIIKIRSSWRRGPAPKAHGFGREDLDKIITFDMGGTAAKASMVEHGEVARPRPGIRRGVRAS